MSAPWPEWLHSLHLDQQVDLEGLGSNPRACKRTKGFLLTASLAQLVKSLSVVKSDWRGFKSRRGRLSLDPSWGQINEYQLVAGSKSIDCTCGTSE